MNRHSTWPCVALMLGALSGAVAWAQAPRPTDAPTGTSAATPITVPRDTGPVVIDGLGDDAIWGSAATLDLLWEVSPRYVEPTTWKTWAKLVHDGATLYVLVVAEDPEPDRIQSRRVPHDGSFSDADYVTLRVDPNASSQRAYVFSINAEGSTADSIESGSSGDAAHDWTGQWQGAARRTATGYAVEFAIPLSTMGIAPRADGEDVGVAINLGRSIGRGRKEEVDSSPVDTRLSCAVCQYQRMTLQKVAIGAATWQVTPYGVASLARTFDPLTRREVSRHTVTGLGADLLFTAPGGHRLLATVNPDFSEVSPDSFQIEANRRFAVLGVEARPFYADSQGFFAPPQFLVDTRQLIDPSGAVQYIYRGDGAATQAAGALFTHDRQTTFALADRNGSQVVHQPGPSNNTFARWRWFPEAGLSVNGTLTSRLGDAGYDNTVAALDATWEVDKRNQLAGQLAFSTTNNPASLQSTYALLAHQQDVAGYLSYTYSGEVFRHSVQVEQFGKDFRADMGYLTQTGIRSLLAGSSFTVARDSVELINDYNASVAFTRTESTDGDPLEQALTISGSVTFRGNTSINVGHTWSDFWTQGVAVPSSITSLGVSASPADGISVGGSVARGTSIYYETGAANAFTSLSANMNYPISPRWLVAWDASGERMDRAGTLLYRSWVTNGALVYTPSSAHRWRLGFNFRDSQDPGGSTQNVALQLQYAYRPSRFTWFYVGYNGAGMAFPGTPRMVRTSDYFFAKFAVGFDDAWFGSAIAAAKR